MTQDHHLPPAVEDASPSTRHVWRTLRLSGTWLSVTDLVEKTGYSMPTIRRAVETLLDAGLVEQQYGAEGDGRERHIRAPRNPK